MTLRAPKADRDEVFLEYAKSICPVCKRVVDGEINVRDGRVILRKRCPDHGPFEALVYSDADLYLSQQRYNKPGTIPLAFQTEPREGCPLDCGLCPDHKQHSCLGIIEVNSGCNLDCPICFAGSGHQPDGFALTVDQIARMLDAFVEAEGEPEVVQFSGGEPTIHPDIVTFIEMAKARGVKAVMLNTNGIRIARDDAFLAELDRVRPHVYLQFDGFDEATHRTLRGRDLRDEKQRALDRCAEAGLTVTLVRRPPRCAPRAPRSRPPARTRRGCARPLQQRHARAEPGEELRGLEAAVPAAENDEGARLPRLLGHLARLVGRQ